MDMENEPVPMIERSMVAIRRSQSRRALARLAGRNVAPQAMAAERDGPRTGPGTRPGTAVLEVLDVVEAAEQAGDTATVSTVASALGVDQPRASKLVAAAVERGLLGRRADQADGRRSLLVRTPAGAAASEQVHDFRRDSIAAALQQWSEADQRIFAGLLDRFVADFGQVTGQEGSGRR
ncbi:MAG TPA: MarR family winged helix-turn-helix transcriptional regulator [Actinomadura sp.]|nr:MarR family winged helix-turn-helix transcriptional regulator [Actinomadura sp.]